MLVIDSEGFAGVDENTNHDSRIFLFALLLSSYFIYNSQGNINEAALQNLTLIVNLAKEIQLKSRRGNNDETCVSHYFPSFMWIVRDFSLRMEDKHGVKITPKEYLENALSEQRGVTDIIENKNRIRRLLKYFFKERDCYTLVRPVEDEEKLQRLNTLETSEFRSEFVS